MSVPRAVRQLIERFDRNLEAYRSGHYNEAQLRAEFIDPFFKALGWDIDNEQGHAEAYRDVVHEDAVKVGGATKAPDYSFRIGGTRKFFLEAKKPSIDIKGDPHPAYQLAAAKIEHEQTALQRQIDASNRQIDGPWPGSP